MAFQASLSLFARDSDAQNPLNFNDHLQQLSHPYWKPRFTGWPLGGETRKRAQTRCVSGLPGSARSDASGGLLLSSNLGARYVDPDAAIFDKQVDLKNDLKARFDRWSQKHLPHPIHVHSIPSNIYSNNSDSISASVRSNKEAEAEAANQTEAAVNSEDSATVVYGGAYTSPPPPRMHPTASWKFRKFPEIPKPMFFEKIAKGEKLLTAGQVPEVKTEARPVIYVAHTRPYEKPWLGKDREPVIFFEKKTK